MIDECWIQPSLFPTFHLLVHSSHCFVDIFNWAPHLHLKINMPKTKLLTFWPFCHAHSSLGCPQFLKSHHSPIQSPLSPAATVTSGFTSSLSLPFLSIPFHSHLNPCSVLDCYSSLLLGHWIAVSPFLIHLPHCSKVSLWLCFFLVENPSVDSNFIACHSNVDNMILNDYVHPSAYCSLMNFWFSNQIVLIIIPRTCLSPHPPILPLLSLQPKWMTKYVLVSFQWQLYRLSDIVIIKADIFSL